MQGREAGLRPALKEWPAPTRRPAPGRPTARGRPAKAILRQNPALRCSAAPARWRARSPVVRSSLRHSPRPHPVGPCGPHGALRSPLWPEAPAVAAAPEPVARRAGWRARRRRGPVRPARTGDAAPGPARAGGAPAPARVPPWTEVWSRRPRGVRPTALRTTSRRLLSGAAEGGLPLLPWADAGRTSAYGRGLTAPRAAPTALKVTRGDHRHCAGPAPARPRPGLHRPATPATGTAPPAPLPCASPCCGHGPPHAVPGDRADARRAGTVRSRRAKPPKSRTVKARSPNSVLRKKGSPATYAATRPAAVFG